MAIFNALVVIIKPSLFGGLLNFSSSTVVSVVKQFAEGTGSNPGGAKVMGTDGICKYLPL